MTEPVDRELIALLRDSDGLLLELALDDGRAIRVFNIAWGYDMGDAHAHVTTNISPSIDGEDIDFFFTHEVLEVKGGLSDELLYERDG